MPVQLRKENDRSKNVRSIQVIAADKFILRARNGQLADGIYSILSRLIIMAKHEGKTGLGFNVETGFKDKNTKLFSEPSESIVFNGDLKKAVKLLLDIDYISQSIYSKIDSDIEQISKELYDEINSESKENPSSNRISK